jgi:hypothetical protein
MAQPSHSFENQVAVGEGTLTTTALERCLTVKEVAALWKLSEDTVRRLFQHEPGVLAISQARHRGKRRYVTLRIPESVLERMCRRLSLVR